MHLSLRSRLARLESTDDQQQQRAEVIYLLPTGAPERQPRRSGGRVIYLPRKARSVEEWCKDVAARFQHRTEQR
jgi:hypothetical protein